MRIASRLALLLALTSLSLGAMAKPSSAHTLSKGKMTQTAQQMLDREVQRSRQGLRPLADRLNPSGLEEAPWPSPAPITKVSECRTTNLTEFSRKRSPHVGLCSYEIKGQSGGYSGAIMMAFRASVRFKTDRFGNTVPFFADFTSRHTRSRSVVGWYATGYGRFADPPDEGI
jgi:hypothetical protein